MTIVEGCDVAVHQGTIDFDELAGATDFILIKATEGTGFTDALFSRNWDESRRTGMTRGAYHFARPDLGNTARAEADWFLGVLAQHGGLRTGDLLALDYEADWDGDVSGWCLAWLERVREVVGFRPLLYLNLSLANRHDWTATIAAGYGLWLAFYDQRPTTLPPTPWPVVAMKQWTSIGILFGIPGRVDQNTFFGSKEQLALYGKPKEGAVSVPVYEGQSSETVTLKKGEVGLVQAIYAYDGASRSIVRKVWSQRPGRFYYPVYPPVDPDADETECLDADPAMFLVTVTP